MILSDREIKKYIEIGKIKIIPKINLKEQLSSASLDLRLGNEFRLFEDTKYPFIDIKDPKTFQNITRLVKLKDSEPIIFQPNQFILAVTLENIFLPDDITARIDGRSSLGRLGIVVHSTAGHIDPGFQGKITLEMSNIGNLPILLYPKTKICQLVFQELSSPSKVPYYKRKTAKYLGTKVPGESKINKDRYGRG
jgi:dCTP deaminase